MIEFKEVQFKNFFNFGNDFTTLSFDKYNFACVSGKNGAGKSAVLIEPIYFTLFGKPFRKVNKDIIVNNVNGKKCLTRLLFNKGKDKYIVERGIKPKVFNIIKNDTPVESKSSDKELQSHLEEKILGFNGKIFKQVCVFGSALFIPFLDLELADRRYIVENILGLEIFSSMLSIIKDMLKEYKITLNENENEVDKLEDAIEIIQKNIDEVEKDIAKEITKITKEIETLKTESENKQKEIDDKQKEIDKLNISKDTVEKKAEKLEKQLNTGNDIKSKKLLKRNELNTTTNNMVADINKLEGKDKCPLCKSIAKNFENLLSVYKKEIESNKNKLSDMDKEIKEILDMIEKVGDLIDVERTKIDEYNDEIDGLEEGIVVRNTLIENNDEYILKNEKKIKELKNKEIINKDGLINDKKKLKKIQKTIDGINQEIKYYNIIKDVCGDSGIKSFITKKYLPVINEKINYYLEKFELGFNFEFDEEFNDHITSTVKKGLVYNALSQGQKSRINNAILFTFINVAELLNSVSTNLLLADEILDSNSLDDEGVENLLQQIRIIATQEQKKILVISHNETTKNQFDQSIEVVMNGMFGTLIEKT